MKSFNQLISEKKGQKAHKQAIAMGLKYKGFGYWVQPATGQVTHKTEGDQLVEVDPEVESEKADKDDDVADKAPSGGFGNIDGGKGASFNTFQNKQLPTGTGTNVQDISPEGVAQAPNTDEGRWEPGPDGDNFVNDQTLRMVNKPQPDSFVGKTNYYNWVAGADGDNYTTLDSQTMLKRALNVLEPNPTVHEQAWSRVLEVLAEGDPLDPPVKKSEMINQLKTGQEGGQTFNDARAALQRVGNRTRQQAMDSIAANPVIPAMRSDQEAGEYTKAVKAYRKIADLPLSLRDKTRVNMMNDQAKGLVQDPNFDMKNLGEELGSGAFGSVFDSGDGSAVIKQGEIGPAELIALHKMRDNPAFPNLLNAQFDTPFRDESVMGARDSGRDIQPGTKQYDKDEMSDFDMRFPTAKGTFAMSKTKGIPLYDAIYEWTPEQKQDALKKIWKARASMHLAGMSHGDMHGGNIMWDRDSGDIGMLDMGMSQDNPMAALMEGIAGVTGEDYQLDNQAGLMNFDDDNQTMGGMKQRLQEIHQDLEDEFAPGDDLSDEAMDMRDNLADLMRGGIRMKDKELQGLQEMFPQLDGSRIKKILKKLYGNFALSDQEERMSDAFEKRQQDSRKVALANILRKQRGEGPIEVKNPNVIPPKNIDFDYDD